MFFNYGLVSERIFFKKACFMYKCKSLQAGLLQEHLPFLQNLLDFIITKYLKQEVDMMA